MPHKPKFYLLIYINDDNYYLTYILLKKGKHAALQNIIWQQNGTMLNDMSFQSALLLETNWSA